MPSSFCRLALKRRSTRLLVGLCLSVVFVSGFRAGKAAEGDAASSTITFFDLSSARLADLSDPAILHRTYDEVFLITSLEGLVNRSGPNLFVRYNPAPDDFWWKKLTEPGGWLHGRTTNSVATLQDLLARFRKYYDGAVVYDERVPSTSNVAASVAGADHLLVLRYDPSPTSLFQTLTKGPNAIPIKVKLLKDDGSPLFTGSGTIPGTTVPSTGSAKNDAYRWLVLNYLKPGKLDPTVLGDYIDCFWLKCHSAGGGLDQGTVNNLDYIIAHHGVVYDLNIFDDEVPVDDPGQKPGTDLESLRLILATCNEITHGKKLLTQFGFVPWAFKYTDFHDAQWNAAGKRGGVAAEWRSAAILSSYNCIMDADALSPSNFANASFYQHQPIPAHIPQKAAAPTKALLISRGVLDPDGSLPHVTFYAYYNGDYDSAAWVYNEMPTIWTDPHRGSMPLSWAINANLSARFPLGLLWMRSTATPQDVFIAGDCGAGYINPNRLTEPRQWSGLPSGVALWRQHNDRYFKQWNLNVTGFVIEGEGTFMKDEALDAYVDFSPGGICTQYPPPAPVFKGMPMLQMATDLPPATESVEKAADLLKTFLASGRKFVAVRTVLWPPTRFADVEKTLDQDGAPPRKLVDLPTLLWLQKYQAGDR